MTTDFIPKATTGTNVQDSSISDDGAGLVEVNSTTLLARAIHAGDDTSIVGVVKVGDGASAFTITATGTSGDIQATTFTGSGGTGGSIAGTLRMSGDPTNTLTVLGGNINTSGGSANSANGGTIAMQGGSTSASVAGRLFTYGDKAAGGDIFTYGGGSISGGATGGHIWTYGGLQNTGTGGHVDTHGADNGAGGNINTSAGAAGNGGSINTSSTGATSGGSIDTHDGGGSIITTGTGSIELGATGTRSTLNGTATSNRVITLPDEAGALLLANGHTDLIVTAPTISDVPVTVQGFSVSQAANLQEWFIASGQAKVASLDFDGVLQLGTAAMHAGAVNIGNGSTGNSITSTGIIVCASIDPVNGATGTDSVGSVFTDGICTTVGSADVPVLDTGWTANADAGDKTQVIPDAATLATIASALNMLVSGSGDALLATAEKCKALETALASFLLPNV